MTNNTAGTVSLIGHLGDGTAFSQSVPISEGGYIPLYVSLYSRVGSLLGWLEITNNPSNTPPQTILGSSISWIKESSNPRTLYAGGFTNTNITLLASIYVPPQRGAQILTNLTNGTLIISNGNLTTNLIYGSLVFEGDKLVSTSPDANPTNELTSVLTPSTGILTLTFRPTGSHHSITATGVILPAATGTNAAGWFLGTNQSGYFLLEQ